MCYIACMSEDNVFKFNTEVGAILQAVLAPVGIEAAPATTASVKFMITIQDENDLLALGYSHEQIGRMTPQEAADIINCGREGRLKA